MEYVNGRETNAAQTDMDWIMVMPGKRAAGNRGHGCTS